MTMAVVHSHSVAVCLCYSNFRYRHFWKLTSCRLFLWKCIHE